ncbi:hypothetical protein BZA77DRAFT_175119 [Pyronema omphalodes]|nr:hypothetical protein BZA77DRAFT_175119 [Pyronema omphalodes]
MGYEHRPAAAWMNIGKSRRRRSFLFALATIATFCFILRLALITQDKWRFNSACTTPKAVPDDPPRLTIDDFLNPDHTLSRTMNTTTQNFEPDYIFLHKLGRGYEGQADIYHHVPSNKTVVIKTFFSMTRDQQLPYSVLALLEKNNITISRWPVDLSATLRRYTGSDNTYRFSISETDDEDNEVDTSNTNTTLTTPKDGTIHPLDIFHVPNTPPQTHPWRMVLPLYPGSLDSVASTTAFLNLTTADLDFLYRPHFSAIFRTLGQMHQTTEYTGSLSASDFTINGFCHDDVKLDNIFLKNRQHELLVGDMGQVRSLEHDWHKSNKWECRLIDAHRSWRTYLTLLREGSLGAEFSAGQEMGLDKKEDQSAWGAQGAFGRDLMEGKVQWAKAYWSWKVQKTLPQDFPEGGWWDEVPEGVVMVPTPKGPIGMTREEAIEYIEGVRMELGEYKKAVKAGVALEKPWWWWEVKRNKLPEEVERELKVIDGAVLVGM